MPHCVGGVASGGSVDPNAFVECVFGQVRSGSIVITTRHHSKR